MADKPHYLGHRLRLRERFQFTGAEGFHDYELLELLLDLCHPRKDVKPIAKRLIERFSSLAGVMDADQRELEAVPEMGPASAMLIRLVKAMGGALPGGEE